MAPQSIAVSVVNKISADALSSIARRIVRRLGDSSSTSLLDEREERQAINTLKVTESELGALVQFSAYVFEQAAYQTQQPDAFENHLTESLGVSQSHASAMRSIWEAEATAYVARLREQHLIGSCLLTDTTWTTHLCVSTSDDDSSTTNPSSATVGGRKNTTNTKNERSSSTQATSVFNLHMNDNEPPLAIECSHKELYAFFEKLQDVQHAIDSLSS